MFFAKYDTDGSRLLESDEVRRMLADLEGQKVELESKLIVDEVYCLYNVFFFLICYFLTICK